MSSNKSANPVALEKTKTRARLVLERLNSLGMKSGLQQAYEILAAAEGHKNWATLRASLLDSSPDKVPVPGRGLGFWDQVDKQERSMPALLMGRDRLDRVRVLRAAARTLGLHVVELDERRTNLDDAFGQRIREEIHTRALRHLPLVFVDLKKKPSAELVAALESWIGFGTFNVVVGARDPSLLPRQLAARFAKKHWVPQSVRRIPKSIDYKPDWSFTIFGATSQAEVDADLLEYAGLIAEPQHAIVLGEVDFEAKLEAALPSPAFVVKTSTIMAETGEPDTKLWGAVLRDDWNLAWVQNLEKYRFSGYETWSGKKEGAMVYAYEIGMAPCGGITAGSKDELFLKIVGVLPRLVWHAVPKLSHSRDGRPKIRISYEGEDCSEQFLAWVRQTGLTFENGELSPSLDSLRGS